jgi:hypothetical protein
VSLDGPQNQIGYVWLKMRQTTVSCEHGNELSVFHKLELSSMAEQLLISHEGLSTTEIIDYTELN